MRSRRASGARSRRPMKRVRTPCRTRSGSSRSIVSVKISIRSSTSSGGRFQFSVENAYTASDSTPRSIAASTVRRSAFVPARWPAAIGSPRRRAQRALPSMMIATLRATSGTSGSGAGRTCRSVLIFVRSDTGLEVLDLHDLGFLVLQQLVDRLRVVIGQLLDAFFRTPLVVVAYLAVLAELLQVLHDVTAHVSHRDLPLLRQLPHDLDELLAPLFVRLRHRQTDHLPVVRRRQAEVGLLDRLLDRFDRRRIERLDRQHPRLGDVDRRELLQRRLLVVVLD